MEPLGREGGVGSGEGGDETPLPRDARSLGPARAARRAKADGDPDERVGGRIQKGPEQRLGCPHLSHRRAATIAAGAPRRHGVRGEREHLRQLRDPLRVFGKRERDGKPCLGAAVRGHDARQDPLASHEIERELRGEAPGGERCGRALGLGGRHRREPRQRLQERHGDARKLARGERLVDEGDALRSAARVERRRGGPVAPEEEARRRPVGQEDDVGRGSDLARPRFLEARELFGVRRLGGERLARTSQAFRREGHSPCRSSTAWVCEDARHEGIALSAALGELAPTVHRRVYRAAELLGHGFERRYAHSFSNRAWFAASQLPVRS